jgi:hypothetical protein
LIYTFDLGDKSGISRFKSSSPDQAYWLPPGMGLYAYAPGITSARRKAVVEPVFGVLKQQRGMRQFRTRGLDKANGEFTLATLAYNITRLKTLMVCGIPLLSSSDFNCQGRIGLRQLSGRLARQVPESKAKSQRPQSICQQRVGTDVPLPAAIKSYARGYQHQNSAKSIHASPFE